MTNQASQFDRYEELLAGRALGDLDAAEQTELERLLVEHGEDESFELVAAEVERAMIGAPEEAPAELRRTLLAEAEVFLDERTETQPERGGVAGRIEPRVSGSDLLNGSVTGPATTIGWLGWIAAAACLLLAALAWLPGQRGPAQPTYDQLASAPGAMTVGLSADLEGELPVGRLAWNGETQTGVMRFEGLPPLDPDEAVYQLWIFDGTREQWEHPLDIKHPVDGGTFNVPTDGGPIDVPIRAKLPVGQPVLFAVTIEPPGGVVVSDRSNIAAVGIPG